MPAIGGECSRPMCGAFAGHHAAIVGRKWQRPGVAKALIELLSLTLLGTGLLASDECDSSGRRFESRQRPNEFFSFSSGHAASPHDAGYPWDTRAALAAIVVATVDCFTAWTMNGSRFPEKRNSSDQARIRPAYLSWPMRRRPTNQPAFRRIRFVARSISQSVLQARLRCNSAVAARAPQRSIASRRCNRTQCKRNRP